MHLLIAIGARSSGRSSGEVQRAEDVPVKSRAARKVAVQPKPFDGAEVDGREKDQRSPQNNATRTGNPPSFNSKERKRTDQQGDDDTPEAPVLGTLLCLLVFDVSVERRGCAGSSQLIGLLDSKRVGSWCWGRCIDGGGRGCSCCGRCHCLER